MERFLGHISCSNRIFDAENYEGKKTHIVAVLETCGKDGKVGVCFAEPAIVIVLEKDVFSEYGRGEPVDGEDKL